MFAISAQYAVASRSLLVCSSGASQSAKLGPTPLDRKSTRLNSSHSQISYAVFCLKKKKKNNVIRYRFCMVTVFQSTLGLYLFDLTFHGCQVTHCISKTTSAPSIEITAVRLRAASW